ncbi:MAG: YceD family protein [Gemmatimonadaceae bacterium]
MLSFDIRSLESHAAIVDEDLSADDPVWEEGDSKPIGAAHVTGRLSAAGPGRFYWHGRIDGDVGLECSRCLSDTTAHVSDETHLIFADIEDEETDDDSDVYRIDPKDRDLDLRPALREEWLLAAPTFGLCRPDCKGLCPRCGADLNGGSHDCSTAESDPRWDGLRKLGQS